MIGHQKDFPYWCLLYWSPLVSRLTTLSVICSIIVHLFLQGHTIHHQNCHLIFLSQTLDMRLVQAEVVAAKFLRKDDSRHRCSDSTLAWKLKSRFVWICSMQGTCVRQQLQTWNHDFISSFSLSVSLSFKCCTSYAWQPSDAHQATNMALSHFSWLCSLFLELSDCAGLDTESLLHRSSQPLFSWCLCHRWQGCICGWWECDWDDFFPTFSTIQNAQRRKSQRRRRSFDYEDAFRFPLLFLERLTPQIWWEMHFSSACVFPLCSRTCNVQSGPSIYVSSHNSRCCTLL